MFGFVKQIFVSAVMFFGCNLSSVNLLECVSVNNQECKVRPEIVNVSSDELNSTNSTSVNSIRGSKCVGSCNNINDPYAKLCVPVVKKLNTKVFMSM